MKKNAGYSLLNKKHTNINESLVEEDEDNLEPPSSHNFKRFMDDSAYPQL